MNKATNNTVIKIEEMTKAQRKDVGAWLKQTKPAHSTEWAYTDFPKLPTVLGFKDGNSGNIERSILFDNETGQNTLDAIRAMKSERDQEIAEEKAKMVACPKRDAVLRGMMAQDETVYDSYAILTGGIEEEKYTTQKIEMAMEGGSNVTPERKAFLDMMSATKPEQQEPEQEAER